VYDTGFGNFEKRAAANKKKEAEQAVPQLFRSPYKRFRYNRQEFRQKMKCFSVSFLI